MKTIERLAKLCALLPLAALFGSTAASAWPACTNIFSTTYPASQTEDLGSCRTCHQSSGGGGNFNRYGADQLANGASGAGASCTNVDFAAVLVAVQDLDSDSEGSTNIIEIQADTQPGWCNTQTSGCSNSAGTPPNVALDPAPQPPGNNAPIANAGGPYVGEAGTAFVQFDGSGSTDADGDALSFMWDFGDQNTASGMMPTHSYASAGTFQVTLVVNDGFVDSDPGFASAVITAPPVNVAPTANPGGPYSGEPGQAVTFDGSGSSDPNGDALSYAWDFGDGSLGSGVSPTHTYLAAGDYTISLVVSDGELDSGLATGSVTIADAPQHGDGGALYAANCLGCHGDPWAGPAIDGALAGLRRVAGARSCNIDGSIFGTSVFPNGVPEMQFLQGLSGTETDALADYLNSQQTSGEQRYVTTCAGCHGDNGAGGRVGESVRDESVGETLEAIAEDSEMRYLACMPRSDIDAIATFLGGSDHGGDDDDERDSDDGGGSLSMLALALLFVAAAAVHRRRSRVSPSSVRN